VGDQRRHISKQRSLRTPRLKAVSEYLHPTGLGHDPVVDVANFSDWGSDPTSEYVVPNWPATPPGRSWREVTRNRPVAAEWVGREPLYPWEAKVYTLATIG
jgi:hypothetical protein